MTQRIPLESVWDYPRPPRLEPTGSHVRVVHRGVVIADSHRAQRILETSHPPVFYIPPEDLRLDLLRPAAGRGSFCEFKGLAQYWDLVLHPKQEEHAQEAAVIVPRVGWRYASPTPPYGALRDHVAFYASRVDECTVDGERVTPQPGDFYGGWITSAIQGPFKGPPGTMGW